MAWPTHVPGLVVPSSAHAGMSMPAMQHPAGAMPGMGTQR
jgi:hypothetical protein